MGEKKQGSEVQSQGSARRFLNVRCIRAPTTYRAGFKLYREERKTRKRARGQHITRINSPCLTWKAIRNTRTGAEGPKDTSTGGGDRAGGVREMERGDRNEEEGTRVRSQFITRLVGLRPIRIFAALNFSVIINLDSSKYSRQPWATAIYEINRVACEDGRERRCNRPRYKERDQGGGEEGSVRKDI